VAQAKMYFENDIFRERHSIIVTRYLIDATQDKSVAIS